MDAQERLQRARDGAGQQVGALLYDASEEVLLALLDNPNLTEEHLQILLSRKNLSHAFLRELTARERLLRPYRVKLAVIRHPRASRSVSLRLLRHVYLFDLAKVAAIPSTPPELRRAAEEAVVSRLTAISLGERLSLARQGTTAMLSALLADREAAVIRTVLDNPKLTEGGVLRALAGDGLTPETVEAIVRHPRWSLRYEVRLAVVRHPRTSLRRMLDLLGQVRRQDLEVLTADRRMPPERRRYLAGWLKQSAASQRRLRNGNGQV